MKQNETKKTKKTNKSKRNKRNKRNNTQCIKNKPQIKKNIVKDQKKDIGNEATCGAPGNLRLLCLYVNMTGRPIVLHIFTAMGYGCVPTTLGLRSQSFILIISKVIHLNPKSELKAQARSDNNEGLGFRGVLG